MSGLTFEPGSEQLVVLKATGEYDRFKDLLRSRLYECGWVDEIYMLCRQATRNSHKNINELYEEVGKEGRGLVPASVKLELLHRVKQTILEKSGYFDEDPE
ncbi:enhancer of yellow 2 transcription factor [Cimex lectularius]|uniref:Enhancer of yellow 2 transcription factor n=1 Tax=Cimex lectularius TaxID=79782 RepID=A0A8I6TDW1_CIMLE|nr:enhancer of yellow 2 transcription factor [Cimex lectularius]